MGWVYGGLGAWLAISAVSGILIGKAIHRADVEQERNRRAHLVVVRTA